MQDLPTTYRGVVYPWQCDHMGHMNVSGVLEIREKVIRFFHEMSNGETGEVSATSEWTAVHLDTVRRRSCPFPEPVIERARSWIVPRKEDSSTA